MVASPFCLVGTVNTGEERCIRVSQLTNGMNHLTLTMIVEQPLTMPVSAKYSEDKSKYNLSLFFTAASAWGKII